MKKNILFGILCFAAGIGVCVGASNLINANEVKYTTSYNTNVTNVNEAIDDLYENSNKISNTGVWDGIELISDGYYNEGKSTEFSSSNAKVDDNSYWLGVTLGTTWLGFKSDNPVKVTKVKIANTTADTTTIWRINYFYVQYSDDGSNYINATDALYMEKNTEMKTFTFSAGSHKYWRVLITNFDSHYYAGARYINFY